MAASKTNYRRLSKPKPYAMVGAGNLVSNVSKTGDEQGGWRYRFSIFRLTARGHVSQCFQPADLVSFVKLIRVLAATLADDGCLSPVLQRELADLAQDLDQLLQVKD